jgi:hypothetical protein
MSIDYWRKQAAAASERERKVIQKAVSLQRDNEILKTQLKEISIILRKGIDST